MQNRQKKTPNSRRGMITVFASLFLIVVMAFLAFVVDWGLIVKTEGELQNAADAGALAGAKALSDGRTAAITAAKLWAGKNTAAKTSVSVIDQDVEVGLWNTDAATFTPLASNSTTTPNAIKVTCVRNTSRSSGLKLFFAPVIGTSSANLQATAIARQKSSRCGLIIATVKATMSGSSHTDSYNSSQGSYTPATAGDNGHVCSNGNISMSGSTAINGNAHPGIGMTVNSSSSIGVTGTTSNLTEPLVYADANMTSVASSNNNGSIPLSADNKNPVNSNNEFVLSGGDSVNLAPGKYYFAKLTLSGGSTIGISGPTEIYVAGNASLSGGSITNLSCLPKNLQLFCNGNDCKISGDSAFYGVVYAPTAKVERSGDSDFYGAIIGGEVILSGSGGIHADESLALTTLGAAPRSILVQ